MSGRVLDLLLQGGEAMNPLSGEASPSQAPPLIRSDSTEVGWTKEEMRQIQLSDSNIGPELAWLEAGFRPHVRSWTLVIQRLKAIGCSGNLSR